MLIEVDRADDRRAGPAAPVWASGWRSTTSAPATPPSRYLRELPVDIIKIDPSFVAGLGTDGTLAMLTRTIVQVGHDLGIEIVAEGIERPEQLELLRAMGCGLGQGYLVARPMTAQGIESLVADERPAGWCRRRRAGGHRAGLGNGSQSAVARPGSGAGRPAAGRPAASRTAHRRGELGGAVGDSDVHAQPRIRLTAAPGGCPDAAARTGSAAPA